MPLILPSAYRHGIGPDDMLHALRNTVDAWELDEGFTMLIGPARDGALLEIGIASSTNSPTGSAIVHADHARPKFLRNHER